MVGCDLRVAGLVVLALSPVVVNGQPVSDSAGVAIATISTSSRISTPAWSLSARPTLIVGGFDTELWQIRDYWQLPDQSVAVLSAGTSDVRIFDRSGSEVARFGRSGGGPGEFEHPMELTFIEPDTVLVLDRGAIEVFLADGTFVRSEPARTVANGIAAGVSGRPVHVAPDRSMLLVANRGFNTRSDFRVGEVFRPPQGLGYQPGPDRSPMLVEWYGGLEQELVEVGGGTTIVVPPFARRTTFGLGPTSGRRMYAADNASNQVDIYDHQGQLRQIVRFDLDRVPVEEQWVEDWKEQQEGRRWTQGRMEVLERAWAEMYIPETLPAFEDVVMDTMGNLWTKRPITNPEQPVIFDVFDPFGVHQGHVEVPDGMTARPRIGEDFFIGVWEDGLGVETVRVYALEGR